MFDTVQKVFSSYYFFFFVAMAATQPFLTLFFNERGISDAHIGLILAAGSFARILAQPIAGALNDNARDPRLILMGCAVCAPIFYFGFDLFKWFWALLLISVATQVAQSSGSVMDAMAVHEGARSGFSYGQVRLWGALSFALTTAVAGLVYHRIGLNALFLVYFGLSIILVFNIWALPKTHPVVKKPEAVSKGIRYIIRNRPLMIFTVICFLLSIGLSINGNFLSLYYKELHYPMSLVGLNFTVAALIEVPLFHISQKLILKFGLMPMIIVASVLYTVKYFIMAMAPGAIAVIAVQVLDGIAYALYWSAAVQLVSKLVPESRAATAQTIFASFGNGLSGIIGASLGGAILQTSGPLALYTCAACLGCISFIGFILFRYFVLKEPLHAK